MTSRTPRASKILHNKVARRLITREHLPFIYRSVCEPVLRTCGFRLPTRRLRVWTWFDWRGWCMYSGNQQKFRATKNRDVETGFWVLVIFLVEVLLFVYLFENDLTFVKFGKMWVEIRVRIYLVECRSWVYNDQLDSLGSNIGKVWFSIGRTNKKLKF